MDIPDDDKLGIVGMALTSFFYLSPIVSFISLLRKKIHYEDTPIIFVIINYSSCFLWFVHSVNLETLPLKYGNMVNCFYSMIMILIYFYYDAKNSFSDALLSFLLIPTGSLAVYRAFTVMIDNDDLVYYLCLTLNTIVYLSPLELVYRAYKENNYNLIQIYSAFISLIICPFWIYYGKKNDDEITIPSIIGIFCAILQILLWLMCKDQGSKPISTSESQAEEIQKIKKIEDDNKKNNENPGQITEDSTEKEKMKEAQPAKI